MMLCAYNLIKYLYINQHLINSNPISNLLLIMGTLLYRQVPTEDY